MPFLSSLTSFKCSSDDKTDNVEDCFASKNYAERDGKLIIAHNIAKV